jgi:hypothetical protein
MQVNGDLRQGPGVWHTKDDGTTDGATYGKLYNWYAVMGTVKEDATPQPHK